MSYFTTCILILILILFENRANGYDRLEGCLRSLESDIDASSKLTDDLIHKIKNRLWTVDGPASPRVEVIIEGNVKGPSFRAPLVKMSIPDVYLPKESVRSLFDGLDVMQQRVDQMVSDLSTKYALTSRANQIVKGKISIRGIIQARRATFDRLQISRAFNQVPTNYLESSVLLRSADQVISARWTFDGPVKVKNLTVSGRLANFNANDILRLRVPYGQEVTGMLSLPRARFNGLSLTGDLNSVKMKDFVQRSSRGYQLVRGVKTFESIRVTSRIHKTRGEPANVEDSNIKVLGRVHGKNFTRLVKNAIWTDRKMIINREVTFRKPITVQRLYTRKLNVARNEIDIDHMVREAVMEDGYNEITGKKLFVSLATRNMTIRGRLNSLRIPNDLVPLDEPVSIASPVVFESPVELRSDLNASLINDIDPNRDLVFTRSQRPQVVRGFKSFTRDVEVDEKVDIGPRAELNNLSPTLFERKIRNLNEPDKDANYVVDNLEISGDLSVGTLNGRRISDLPTVLLSKTKDQIINTPITFMKSFTVKSVFTPQVNGIRIPHDLVPRQSDAIQVIYADKKFRNVVTRNRISLGDDSFLNGYNWTSLSKSMYIRDPYRTMASFCRGKKTFDHLRVAGRIVARSFNG